jgi:anti-sigma factor ChrR (cupin superfamily)
MSPHYPGTGDDRGPAATADTPVLDADTLALLTGAIAEAAGAEPGDEVGRQRVKRRLLARIAEDQRPRHLTVQRDDGGWQPFGEGLTIKVLHESGGIMSYLVRLVPGAALPAHRHPVDEECVVLEGALTIGSLELGAGGFHLGRQGALHDRIVSRDGALIYLRGAIPDAVLLI